MVSNSGYAVIIGVDDYSSFGAGNDLKGSCNDVRMLYWFARNLLGLPPGNIRVLVSKSRVAAEPLWDTQLVPPPETVGEATRESILAGVAWLVENLKQNQAAPGLLTFSGHGSYSKDKGSLLCPSDVGPDFAKAIAVRDLSTTLASKENQTVRERLTVVLDCCHVVGDASAPELRTPTGLPHNATADAVAADHADFDVSERVLLAARPGQSAYQAKLGKVFHGALTFALVTVAEQWKASQDLASPGMHVSYKQLLKRVRRMLWSLRVKQNVHLRVPESPMSKRKAVRGLPFFGTHQGVTVRAPDAERDRAQVDAGWVYTFKITNGSNVYTLAWVLVTGATGASITVTGHTAYNTVNTYWEHWYINTNASTSNYPAIAALGVTGTSISVVRSAILVSQTNTVDSTCSGSSPTTSAPMFNCAAVPSGGWSQTAPGAGAGSTYYYSGTDINGNTLVMRWDLSSTGTNVNGVVWYYSQTALPEVLPSTGAFTLQSSNPITSYEKSLSGSV